VALERSGAILEAGWPSGRKTTVGRTADGSEYPGSSAIVSMPDFLGICAL